MPWYIDPTAFLRRFKKGQGTFKPSIIDICKLLITRREKKWPATFESPLAQPPPKRVEGDQLRVTYINHSTCLIQTQGLNMLTDPIFSKRAGPMGWFGAKRAHPPGVLKEFLPRINVVLISHDHWDHFDLPFLKWLSSRDYPVFMTGLGLRRRMLPWFFAVVYTFDWWDSLPYDEHEITFTPAQHWAGRYLVDKNSTLWGGWLVRTPTHTVYFAGDSGYGPHFKDVKKKLDEVGDSIDLAILPIGAHEPRWFMKHHHMNPDDAVMAHLDLGAKHSIGVHWNTFDLAWDHPEDTLRELNEAIEKHQLEPGAFRTLKPGEALLL